MGLPPILAPAAYSHDPVAKKWPRNCEAPGQNRAIAVTQNKHSQIIIQ